MSTVVSDAGPFDQGIWNEHWVVLDSSDFEDENAGLGIECRPQSGNKNYRAKLDGRRSVSNRVIFAMSTIFVSYRRTDSIAETKLLKQKLTEWFGNELVFRDEDAIPFGFDFRDVIRESLAESVAVLVVLGEHWLEAMDESGRRRLDLEDDPVRVEIELALSSKVPVIPVLLRNAQLPSAEALPEKLKPLRYRNAIVFDVERSDESALRALRDDLAQFIVSGRTSKGAARRDTKGRYIPSGVTFFENRTGWTLKATYEIVSIHPIVWPGVFLPAALTLIILGQTVGAVPLYLYSPPHNSGLTPPFTIFRFAVFEANYYATLFCSFLLLAPFLCIPFLRWPYRTFLENRVGRLKISLRGETLCVSDGLPFKRKIVTTKLNSVESFETREDGFGLVVNVGGRLDIRKCFEFGSRLSIAKRLFIVRAMNKLLADPAASKIQAQAGSKITQSRV